ncbi:MAG: chemotaxis protein CheB [Myxococcota bacterium]|nr:chemotaxis protein CheB [Myxococcota bacterium]
MRTREKPCRVLFVDEDLLLARNAAGLFDSGEVEPCPRHATFEGALASVRDQHPDIVVVELSGADAFGAIEAIMAEAPTPILALQQPHQVGVDTFHALGLGALEITELSPLPTPQFWRELGRKLELLSQVRVVRHVRGARRKRQLARTHQDHAGEPPFPLVAVASSLGGPRALSVVLRSIPKAFAAPIVICQHISAGFTGGLALWLAAETALKVVEARDGDWLTSGTVFIAPSGAHLMVTDDGRARLDRGPPLQGFRPSCDALLTSAAHAFNRRCIGVVLTGMGRDGARGLKEIRSRGGRTVAQDEASSVVYGMPAAAVELGAAEEILPLDEIAKALIRLVEQC